MLQIFLIFVKLNEGTGSYILMYFTAECLNQYSTSITLFIFMRLGYVLGANYDGNQSMDGVYRLDKDSVDVVFYGSSHVYSGVNVAALWDDYGIAGYDMAGTMQTLWNSYYN